MQNQFGTQSSVQYQTQLQNVTDTDPVLYTIDFSSTIYTFDRTDITFDSQI